MRWARLEHKAAALARDARVAGVLVREVGLAAAVASVAGEAVRAVGAHVRRGALACDARVTGVLVREVGLAAVVWTKGRGCECWAAGECWMVGGGWWVVGWCNLWAVDGGRWPLGGVPNGHGIQHSLTHRKCCRSCRPSRRCRCWRSSRPSRRRRRAPRRSAW